MKQWLYERDLTDMWQSKMVSVDGAEWNNGKSTSRGKEERSHTREWPRSWSQGKHHVLWARNQQMKSSQKVPPASQSERWSLSGRRNQGRNGSPEWGQQQDCFALPFSSFCLLAWIKTQSRSFSPSLIASFYVFLTLMWILLWRTRSEAAVRVWQ